MGMPKPCSHNRIQALISSAFCVLVLLQALGSAPGLAAEIELSIDNDFLASNETDDDLYSFSVELRIARASHFFVLQENAFTDKRSGSRFDETSLFVGRHHYLRRRSGWDLRWQVGATHVGRGLFGQEAQNAVHRLIGNLELDLRYPETSKLYLSWAIEAGKEVRLGPRLSIGPHLAFESITGFKTHAFAGLSTAWRFRGTGLLRLSIGLKASSSSDALLAAHLEELTAGGEVAIDLPGGLVTTWSFNRYGTGRQHVSFGYRFPSSRARDTDGRHSRRRPRRTLRPR